MKISKTLSQLEATLKQQLMQTKLALNYFLDSFVLVLDDS